MFKRFPVVIPCRGVSPERNATSSGCSYNLHPAWRLQKRSGRSSMYGRLVRYNRFRKRLVRTTEGMFGFRMLWRTSVIVDGIKEIHLPIYKFILGDFRSVSVFRFPDSLSFKDCIVSLVLHSGSTYHYIIRTTGAYCKFERLEFPIPFFSPSFPEASRERHKTRNLS